MFETLLTAHAANPETEEVGFFQVQRRRRRPERTAGVPRGRHARQRHERGRLAVHRARRGHLVQGDGDEGLDAAVLLRDPPLDAGQDQGQVAPMPSVLPEGGAGGSRPGGRRRRRRRPSRSSIGAPTARAADAARVDRRRAGALERRAERARRHPRHPASSPARRSSTVTYRTLRAAGAARRRPRRHQRIAGPLLVAARATARSTSRTSTGCGAPSTHALPRRRLPAAVRWRLHPRLLGQRRQRKAGRETPTPFTPAASRRACGPTTTTRPRWSRRSPAACTPPSRSRPSPARADREFVSFFAQFGTLHRLTRAFVGNTPVFHARVGDRIQWDVSRWATTFTPSTSTGTVARPGGVPRTPDARSRGVLPRALARGPARAPGCTTATWRATWRRA